MAERGQRSAIDRKQGRHAERLAKDRALLFSRSLTTVLRTPEGRIVFAEWLQRAGVYRSVFHDHPGRQGWNIGRQDFGHELMADLIATDEAAFELMEREYRERERREAEVLDAVATPATATDNEDQE